MDTWKVAKWMSESVKTVFSAVTNGPSDAVKFGEKSESDNPFEDCNTKHEVQGFRTIADKAGKKSHALTDQIIVDFRGRDTDDCDWKWAVWNTDCSYNTTKSEEHATTIRIFHEDDENPVHSFEMAGVNDGSGWVSSQRYLITKAGKWTLKAKAKRTGSCGDDVFEDWTEIGSFTAEEPLEDCYYQGREEGANVGDCGDCLTGYTEVDGECQADSSSSGDGVGGGGSFGTMDNSQIYIIGGGVLLLALLLKRKKS